MDLIIKGLIIGIGKILPGISGSILAITLGIYEKIIDAISNFKKDFIKNAKFLSKIGIGIIISVIIFSKIIVKCINNYYFATMLLFIGMIIGGMPKIIRKTKINKKNTIIAIIVILIIFILPQKAAIEYNHTLEYTPQETIKLIGIGIVDALASIIPGISGTAILMLLGYYNIIIDTFASITQITKIKTTIFTLIPFGIGFIIGTIYISKIIDKILKKNKDIINTIIIIFMTTTNILLIKKTMTSSYTPQEFIIGIILFIIGVTIALYTNKKE